MRTWIRPRLNAHDVRAFTLIELLVVVAVVAILMGLLLPSLGAARRMAQQSGCQSNLRQMALGLTAFATDHNGDYCTGPSSNNRNKSYGAIDKKGWIADLVVGEYGEPGKALCPSHPAQYSQEIDLNRLNDNSWDGSYDAERQEQLLDRGFNSNYCQSWFCAYSEMNAKTRVTGSRDPKRTSDVRGPLNSRMLGRVAISQVPLIGDARTDQDDTFMLRGREERAVKALGDGPLRIGAEWQRQDFDDWGCAHGRSSSTSLQVDGGRNDTNHDKNVGNIAFADGHVTAIKDRPNLQGQRDGFWGSQLKSFDDGSYHVYDELEGIVFGGRLSDGERFDPPN